MTAPGEKDGVEQDGDTAVREPSAGPGTVAILGGTGEQGRGLARRLAMAGLPVVLGSRAAERAAAIAEQMRADDPGIDVTGADNATAAARGSVVVVAVPYEGHRELLAGLAEVLRGKLVVDCVNPLGFDKRGAYLLDVPEGSAAQEAAAVLPDSRLVAAFHHVSAKLLLTGDDPVDTDVLVIGDDREAKDEVIDLVGQIKGMRGIDAGALRLAPHVEGMTAALIAMNRRYKAHAGLRVTDV
jgi:NADPH-dependent F420 reductase